MKTFKLFLPLLIFISILSGCREDSFNTEIEMIPPPPQTNIETTVNGFITDLNGVPMEDATVRVLNGTTQSNEFGFFELTGLVNEQFALIEIEKDGYFNQYETLRATKTATNRTRIQMIEKNISGTFSSATGGLVPVGSQSSVNFKANSFVDKDGNTYSGEVSIYTAYIDPSHENTHQFMPGNLLAYNLEEELNILQSFGMINVEIEGENGEKLDINQSATITVDVPQLLSSDAPAEIPLWYFDETSGLWKEEGRASLENGKYIGEVNHFTLWNCDIPGDVTFITGQLQGNQDISISRIRITSNVTGTSYTTFSDSEGFFSGFVPRNEDLELEVFGLCGDEVIFSFNIGTFTEETADLGAFNIFNNVNFSTITGTLIDCDQTPIPNGQVYFNLLNQPISQQTFTDEAGFFTAVVPSCSMAEIEIRGINLEDGLVSQTITVTENSVIELGNIDVCDDISPEIGSVIYNLDDEQKIFDNCIVSTSNNGNAISYNFRFYDVLTADNDTMYYNWFLSDTNSDLSNPSWQSTGPFYGPPAAAEDDLYFIYSPFYQSGVTEITVEQVATSTGDIMQFSFENLRVGRRINDPTGPNVLTTFTGVDAIITAVLQ